MHKKHNLGQIVENKVFEILGHLPYMCFEQFWLIFTENFNPIPVSMSTLQVIGSSIKKSYDTKTELEFFISTSIVVSHVTHGGNFTICITFNSLGAKFQLTFVVCFFFFFFFNKLSPGKKFICKVERLNVKQRRSRWDGSLWAVSSGSVLFAKACYYHLCQWKS